MEVLKKIAEEFFGNEFQCKVYSNGITLAAKDNSRGFCFGLISYPGSFRVREKIYAMKRFEEVEFILGPLLKKYEISQGDFEQGVYRVDFIGTIRKGILIKEIPGVDDSFIEDMTRFDVESELQIRMLLSVLKKAILFLEDEFINRYQTLQQVYEAQQQMTPAERGQFFMDPGPIRFLAIETLCNATKELDSIFDETLNDYEEIEKELPGMFKDHYLVALELLRYFKAR